MRIKSIWGKTPARLYRLIDFLKPHINENFKACIVGCSDGKFLLPFARAKINVVGYEIDKVALYGGIKSFPYKNAFVDRQVIGLEQKIKLEKLEKFVNIQFKNFYKENIKEKFNFVFTSCSLHYSINSSFTLKEKTEKLQELVKLNGFLYIDYMMAIDEKDYINYPANKFYRKNEIINYFDKSKWKIIHIKENNKPSFEAAHVECTKDHYHRFGYMFAQRYK